ncbi:hypothetical protein G5V57_29015 [Nordella sp. HKS 07]|uniref:hypothetical protein n=1 Tax=Nordella sp. HKS 07 TaxID=2712222 RepID=UPI0013E1C458|nr:hypothetical protein [Nordella sp. HKS 07]QIG51402.1 hypothetical protein G5V57_29015 [Nordella sp. HKS 07]
MGFNVTLAHEIGLTPRETAILRKLATPERVQDFITGMPSNTEPNGDTCYSVRMALRENCCHCIEGAFIAACALMLHGAPALLMDFQAQGDDDHVLALFKRGRHWGAISKSNSIWLRWRDPIYTSPRELAMSYFHEYILGPKKSLRRVSKPFDIGAYRPEDWITAEKNCWDMAVEIDRSPHVALITAAQARRLKLRDSFETYADTIKEFVDSEQSAFQAGSDRG